MFFLAQTTDNDAEQMGEAVMVLFLIGIIFCAAGVFFFYFLGWYLTNRPGSRSPYSGEYMIPATDLTYDAMDKVHDFMSTLRQRENALLDLEKAAVCRQTGRIFPNALTMFGVIKMNWKFLKKHYPGNWVSWGSLNDQQRKAIYMAHDSLQGFQFEYGSERYSPREVEREYAMLKPGPLYVDFDTRILMGWMCVPDTDLEVLVVQKPNVASWNGGRILDPPA